MRLIACLAPALLLSLAAPALAEEPAAPAPAKPVKPKKFCRVDSNTGSIMNRSVCHTKAEWDAIDHQNASSAANSLDLRDRGMTGGFNTPPSAN